MPGTFRIQFLEIDPNTSNAAEILDSREQLYSFWLPFSLLSSQTPLTFARYTHTIR